MKRPSSRPLARSKNPERRMVKAIMSALLHGSRKPCPHVSEQTRHLALALAATLPVPIVLPSSPFRRSYPYPAAFPLSTPLLALSSTSLLLYLAARPLLALTLSLYLRAPVTLSSLRFRPLRRELCLRGLHLRDPRNRPLLSLKSLNVSLAPSAKPTSPTSTPLPKNLLQITVDSPSINALFDSNLLTSSNWTLFADNFRKGRSPPRDAPAPPNPGSSSAPSVQVAVSVTNDIHLSLRSVVLNNARLIPDVTLSNVSITAADVRTPENLSHFVNSLTARTIASVHVSSFPKEFRSAARKYSRRFLKEDIARGIQVTREKVGDVRRRVEAVDQYVLRGLPDVEGVSGRVKSVMNVLKGIENLLGAGMEQEKQVERAAGGEEHKDREKLDVVGRDGFRELDEGEAQ